MTNSTPKRSRRHGPGALRGGGEEQGQKASPAPCTLAECHAAFRKWLGAKFDLDALDAMLCTLAVERLDGDPLWLLIIAGSGGTKTELVRAAEGAGALVCSTISGEGALLSGTSTRERADDATGGLLRKIGARGSLILKDATSILGMNRDRRAEVLSALREIYDGEWSRNLGSDGGRTLSWRGRLAIIGACTTAWDSHHAVIAKCGDRFVIVRMAPTAAGRRDAYSRTMAATGHEGAMRAELADSVGGVLAGLDREADLTLSERALDALFDAADLVTRARTGVERDGQGRVIDAHAPELPTRFAKQLQQLYRGAIALGMSSERALRLAIRAARDSVPPLRLALLEDLAREPHSGVKAVAIRLNKPRNTVDRELAALQLLGLAEHDEVVINGSAKMRWEFALAEGVDPSALLFDPSSQKSPDRGSWGKEGGRIGMDKSGKQPAEPERDGGRSGDRAPGRAEPARRRPIHMDDNGGVSRIRQ